MTWESRSERQDFQQRATCRVLKNTALGEFKINALGGLDPKGVSEITTL